jgi:hypothetical protein
MPASILQMRYNLPMKPQQKLYSKTKGLRFRKSPDASDAKGIIKELQEGEELTLVEGPWLKVKVGTQEGWVHGDYVTEVQTVVVGTFKVGVPNLSKDAMTIAVRKEINDEFGGGKEAWELQCTEYVTYRVKTKLGVTISWPVKSGRNGGKWGSIFQKHGTYKVSSEPKANCAMSFTTGVSSNPAFNEIGHVAFVEEVYPDGSIRISEANWPRNGIYNERTLTKQEWRDKYKALFTNFTV